MGPKQPRCAQGLAPGLAGERAPRRGERNRKGLTHMIYEEKLKE